MAPRRLFVEDIRLAFAAVATDLAGRAGMLRFLVGRPDGNDGNMTRINKQWNPVLAGVLLLVASCSGPDRDEVQSDAAPALQTLTGEAFYRERKYVPPGAKLNVTLEDVSKADASSTVIASSTTLLAGSQPYQFTLDYSPADIDARLQYSLRATITFYDDLLFTSTRRYDPFANPDEPISIELQAISWPQ